MFLNSGGYVQFRISHTSIGEDTFAEYTKKNNILIKAQLSQPQFIPLPHDQQVKLRTFANKTNISFGCEIEPTLKASVPKSLSSTVSTHTEQIDNLGKELDKVKKLEESTVSTVTTESDFTTVENTSNGYFDDVKLEGRTLVNLADIQPTVKETCNTWYNNHALCETSKLKLDEPYTMVIYCNYLSGHNYNYNRFELGVGNTLKDFNLGLKAITMPTSGVYTVCLEFKDFNHMPYLACRPCRRNVTPVDGEIANYDISVLILEGDHTQNPPEFFEGLKSVGQDVDEISVLSCNENLFNVDDVISEDPEFYKCNEYIEYTASGNKTILKNDFAYNTVYTFKFKASSNRQGNTVSINFSCKYTDGTIDTFVIGNCKPNTIYTKTFTSAHGKTIEELTNTHNASETITLYLDETSITKGEQPKLCGIHKQDKKPLLYYNDETQTWEKPILRQWDSIEKHNDGKYYYHKRSGEAVLNGSENWVLNSSITPTFTTVYTRIPGLKAGNSPLVSDKFINLTVVPSYDTEFIKVGGSANLMYININPNKLSTQDVAGFKQWLQTNNVTVVYQLAEEEVYECTSIDLMTYKNETNYIVTAGAITPKSTLKVMCNINNVVRELQQKVSNLENYIQHVMIDALNNALNE